MIAALIVTALVVGLAAGAWVGYVVGRDRTRDRDAAALRAMARYVDESATTEAIDRIIAAARQAGREVPA